jgi:hypothetical protein
MARFRFYNNIFFSVNAMQPVRYVKCNPSTIGAVLQFPRLDQGRGQNTLVDFKNSSLGSQQWFN